MRKDEVLDDVEETGGDPTQSLDSSLTSEVIRVYKSMHDECTKLVNTVREQNAKICGVENQLGTVITLLQSINNSSVQQRLQISQQN